MAVVRNEVSTTSWAMSTTGPFCRIAFLFVLLPSAYAVDNDDYHYDEKEGTGSDHNINDEGLWRCRWDHWIEGKVDCGLPYPLIIHCNAVVLARVVRTDRQDGQVKPAAVSPSRRAGDPVVVGPGGSHSVRVNDNATKG